MGLGAKLKALRKRIGSRSHKPKSYNEPDASAAPGLNSPGTPPLMLDADVAAWGFPPELRQSREGDRPD